MKSLSPLPIFPSVRNVFFSFESNPLTSRAMALYHVLIRELLTTGTITGMKA